MKRAAEPSGFASISAGTRAVRLEACTSRCEQERLTSKEIVEKQFVPNPRTGGGTGSQGSSGSSYQPRGAGRAEPAWPPVHGLTVGPLYLALSVATHATVPSKRRFRVARPHSSKGVVGPTRLSPHPSRTQGVPPKRGLSENSGLTMHSSFAAWFLRLLKLALRG
jgi:hypothetical protein